MNIACNENTKEITIVFHRNKLICQLYFQLPSSIKSSPDSLVESLRHELERALTSNKEKREKVWRFLKIDMIRHGFTKIKRCQVQLSLGFCFIVLLENVLAGYINNCKAGAASSCSVHNRKRFL